MPRSSLVRFRRRNQRPSRRRQRAMFLESLETRDLEAISKHELSEYYSAIA